MTEEEKKAIEWLYAQRGKYYKIAKEYIQKLQAEIEEFKKDNNHQWEERCKLTFELEKKEADIEIKDKVIEQKNRLIKSQKQYIKDLEDKVEEENVKD